MDDPLATIYHVFGHFLILVNLLSYVMVVSSEYRKKKLELIKQNGYYLWQDQLVTVAEVALGVLLISI